MTWSLPAGHAPTQAMPAMAASTGPDAITRSLSASGGFGVPQPGVALPEGDDPYAALFRQSGAEPAGNPHATQVMAPVAPAAGGPAQPAYDQPIDYQSGAGRPYSEPYEGPYADEAPAEPPRSSRAAMIGIGVAALAVLVIVISLITIGGGTPTPAAAPNGQQSEVVPPSSGASKSGGGHEPSTAPSGNASPTQHTPGQLQLGDSGPEVKALQARLKQLHYYNGDLNGTFDQATQDAVTQFQQHAHTADPLGVVGRSTRTALFAAGSRPRLSVFNPGGDGGDNHKGVNPEDVKRLQRALGAALNQNVKATGTFDMETLAAVMKYQAAVGLTPDGTVGDKVWGALQQGKIAG